MNGNRRIVLKKNNVPLPQAALVGLTGAFIQKKLSLPTQCELYFREPPGPLQTASDISMGAELEIRLEDERMPLFEGEVTAVEHLYGPDNVQQVYIRAYDRLHRLQKHQPIRMFEERYLKAVIEQLVAIADLRVISPTLELGWRRMYQYDQHNFGLLEELAASFGLYFTLRGRRLHLMTLEGMGAPFDLTLGQNATQLTAEENSADAAHEVVTLGWDPTTTQLHTGKSRNGRSGRRVRTTVSTVAVGGGKRRYLVNQGLPTFEFANQLAQATLDYSTGTEVVVHGEVSHGASLEPGCRVNIHGIAQRLKGQYVLTEVTHELKASGALTTRISTAPPPPLKRERPDVTTFGEVTRIDDPLRGGRVRVQLPTYDNLESEWMTIVTPGAGRSKGFITLPEVGDKVLVTLTQGDPARGIVIGGLYGSDRFPYERNLVGRNRQRWLTPGGQQISMDDMGNSIRLENDSGAYIELAGGRIRIVGNRIDFKRINPGAQLLDEAEDGMAAQENIKEALSEWLQRRREKEGLFSTLLIILFVLLLLAFLGYVLLTTFISGG